MKVIESSAQRLVLRGTPGGRIAVMAMTAIGLALTGAFGYFAAAIYDASNGLSWGHLPLALGVGIGQLLFWVGAVTLAVGRVLLVLDRGAREGVYDVRSPIIDAGEPCRFRLEDIAHLEMTATEEARPRTVDGAGFDATVVRLRLLLNRPRRAITLDETQNGNVERIERLRDAVSAWLEG